MGLSTVKLIVILPLGQVLNMIFIDTSSAASTFFPLNMSSQSLLVTFNRAMSQFYSLNPVMGPGESVAGYAIQILDMACSSKVRVGWSKSARVISRQLPCELYGIYLMRHVLSSMNACPFSSIVLRFHYLASYPLGINGDVSICSNKYSLLIICFFMSLLDHDNLINENPKSFNSDPEECIILIAIF